MLINYDTVKISNALRDFYNATGIDMELLKPDFTPVCGNGRVKAIRYCEAVQSTGFGRNACCLSDTELLMKCSSSKKTEMSVCHAGLLNVAIPLLYDDAIIGYIIFGRMKPETDHRLLSDYSAKLGLDGGMLGELYAEIPYFTKEKIDSVSNIAIMLAKYILLKNMLRPALNDNVQKTAEYISENLSGDLSIIGITKGINVSKSVLYKDFREYFNCTVGEYIKIKRVERSVELMNTTSMSIDEISRSVGFADAAYYCRIFKKQMGVSPARYRKGLNK